MPALVHGHLLKGLKSQVLGDIIGGEALLEDDDLIADLAEANQEVAVGGGGVNFITELTEGGPRGIEPRRIAARARFVYGKAGGWAEREARGQPRRASP